MAESEVPREAEGVTRATDLGRVESNVRRIIEGGGNAGHVEQYLAHEGMTGEEFRGLMVERAAASARTAAAQREVDARRANRSVVEAAGHGLGVGSRDVLEGAAGTGLGLLYDAAALPINGLAAGIDWAFGTHLPRVNSAAHNAAAVADAAGLPEAETAGERTIGNVNRAGVALLDMAAGPGNWLVSQAPRVAAEGAALLPGASRVGQAAETVANGAGRLAERALAPHVSTEAAARGGRIVAGAMPRGFSREAAEASAPLISRALSEAPVAQAVGAGAGALAQSYAHEQGASPWVEAGAALLGGAGGTLAASAAPWAARAVSAPFHAVSDKGIKEAAREGLLGMLTRPGEALGNLNAPRPAHVSGSMPTTAEVMNDVGGYGLERTMRANGHPAAGEFTLRDAQRNDARREFLLGMEDNPGTLEDLDAAVKAQVQRVRDAATAGETEALLRAEEEISRLGEGRTPEAAGAIIRRHLEAALGEAKARTSAAYRAIDPEGTSQIPLGPVRARAAEIEREYFGDGSAPMPEGLQKLVGFLGDGRETVPWATMQRLRRWAGQFTGREHPPEVQAMGNAVREAIDSTARRAAEAWEIPSHPVGLDDVERNLAAEGAAAHPDVAGRLGMTREEGAATASGEERAGWSLSAFVRSLGGIQNQGGEVSAIYGNTARSMPGVWSNRGMTLDRMAQAAVEDGRLSAGSGPRELLEALSEEERGNMRFGARGDTRTTRGGAGRETAADDLDREIYERGGVLHEGDPGETLRTLRPAEENAPAAGAARPEPVQTYENAFTPEQAERWRDATHQRSEQGRVFGGPVEEVTARDYGRPALENSQVPGRFLRSNTDGGPEAAAQLIEAAGGRTQAVDAFRDFIVNRLHAAANGGELTARHVQQFLGRYSGALSHFPELRAQFGNVQAATEAVTAARQAGAREVSRAETGVARFFLGRDPVQAIQGVLGAGNRVQAMRQLHGMVASDPVAVAGLRRAFVEAFIRKAETSAVDVLDNPTLSAAAASRFWRENRDVAAVIFRPHEVGMMEGVLRDFASGQRVNHVGRAIGSNTAQNLSTAAMLGRITGGLIDPNHAQRILGQHVGRVVEFFYKNAGKEAEALLTRAMLDPEVARALMAGATPRNMAVVAGYLEKTMPQRLREVGGVAAHRAGQGALTGYLSAPSDERRDAR